MLVALAVLETQIGLYVRRGSQAATRTERRACVVKGLTDLLSNSQLPGQEGHLIGKVADLRRD
jgi:hypothetical protein